MWQATGRAKSVAIWLFSQAEGSAMRQAQKDRISIRRASLFREQGQATDDERDEGEDQGEVLGHSGKEKPPGMCRRG